MKELSIEEKAKAYDKVIERAIKHCNNDGLTLEQYETIDIIFPELKKSEDERIRKWIRKELESKYVVDNIVNNVMADKALAWLEKQENNSLPSVTDKETLDEYAYQVTYDLSNDWLKTTPTWDDVEKAVKLGAKWFEKQSKQKPAEQSEKYIADVFEKVGLAKVVREFANDNLTNALQDAMIELSKFTPQPKQEWSKEDIEMLNSAILFVEHSAFTTIGKGKNNVISWLKNLRDRVKS